MTPTTMSTQKETDKNVMDTNDIKDQVLLFVLFIESSLFTASYFDISIV